MGKKIEHGLEMEGDGSMSYIRRLRLCTARDEMRAYSTDLVMSVVRRKQQLRWNWNKKLATEDQSDGKVVGVRKDEILGISLLQGWLWGGCKSD